MLKVRDEKIGPAHNTDNKKVFIDDKLNFTKDKLNFINDKIKCRDAKSQRRRNRTCTQHRRHKGTN